MSSVVRTEHTVRYVSYSVELPTVIGELHKVISGICNEAEAEGINITFDDSIEVITNDGRLVLRFSTMGGAS